jgi:hypothetical protein
VTPVTDVPRDRPDALADAIAEYLHEVDAGRPPDRRTWLSLHPDLAGELDEFFTAADGLRVWMGPLQAARAAADAPPCPDPEEIDGYPIVGALGRGGMGVVYKARDRALPRFVAVKVLRGAARLSESGRARFRREAEALARLQHPNVVQILGTGEHDGQPYLVLEYVAGGSLDDRLRGQPQPPRDAALLVERLARAVGAAHRVGIIHRDLKPANVLLAPAAPGDSGSTPYGIPKVSDFGLARSADPGERLTVGGALAGTPHYMAPEQTAGAGERVGPATDVYALGVILYEMLTGRPPFEAATSFELLARVSAEAPRPPRLLRPDLPAELERVCLKCLEKDPANRYPTPEALADDLKRFLEPKPPRWLWGAAVAAVLLGLAALLVQHFRETPAPAVPVAPAWACDIDIRLWDPADAARRGLSLHDPGVLPLKPGDRFRVEARVNRPAYLYVVWIDTEGHLWPGHPWREADWRRRGPESPAQKLSLPEEGGEGFEVPAGPPGTETLVLLARSTPLPDGVDLAAVVGGLPAQTPPAPAAVWFENGERDAGTPARERSGSPFARRTAIDDPVLRTQMILKEKLQAAPEPLFEYTRAVCFPDRGGP